MRNRNETRKFKKIRKGSKNYSTRRNKSGGLTLFRYFSPDGRLLEEFKKKIRDVSVLKALLDTPNPKLEVRENIAQIGDKVFNLKRRKDATNVNFDILKNFVDNNNVRLYNILEDDNMQIEKRDFYKKIREEVARKDDALSPTSSILPNPGMDDESEGEIITNSNGNKVYVNSNLPCGLDDKGIPYLNEDGQPSYFTSDIGKDEDIANLRCRFCFKSKRQQQEQQQGQGGGSRRRRRNTRSRKNKTRRNGKCRACRCPGGCTRSTCPCYRGRSKPCCTKRCRSRGRGCKC